MKSFKVTIAQSGSPIVANLNANVAIATFGEEAKGLRVGELYSSPNECDLIIALKTCPPVNGTYVRQVLIKF